MFCCGQVAPGERDEEVLALDTRRGRYRRLLVDDQGRLAGAILLGDLRDARRLRELLASREEVPAELLDGFADAPPEGYGDESVLDADPEVNVCSCQGVTRGEIVRAIRDRDLRRVDQVAEHTRASTGCGGCRADVEGLLAAHAAEREPLAAGRSSAAAAAAAPRPAARSRSASSP